MTIISSSFAQAPMGDMPFEPEMPPVDVLLEGQEEQLPQEAPRGFDTNLAEVLDDSQLAEIATQVEKGYEEDKASRAEWERGVERGMELLGIKLEDKNEPFPGACGAVHPLLIESAVKFQSKAIQELFPPGGPVRTQIIGASSLDLEAQATRVRDYMNYQLTELCPEYFDDFERLLFALPVVGSSIKKIYFDKTLGRVISEYIPIDQFHVNYYAADLRRAERYTHVFQLSHNDFLRRVAAGTYRDVDVGEGGQPEQSTIQSTLDQLQGMSPPATGEVHTLLEQHRYLLLEGDPAALAYEGDGTLALPYVVTLDKESKKVLAIRRNWKEDDQLQEKLLWFAHYKYVPGFGFYGLGLTHLVGNLSAMLTSSMRSLVDAGQFANLQAGFKNRNFRDPKEGTPLRPGEWRDVEIFGPLNEALFPLNYKEPSQTLFQLLQWGDQRGLQFADSAEALVADSTNYGPVGTTMALLEQSTKFFSAVHKRIHKSQRDEFRIISYLNGLVLPPIYPYRVAGGLQQVLQQDFDGRVDVLPVSDPNIPSQAHRFALAQLQLQIAQQSPQYHNMPELLKRIYIAAGVQEPEQVLLPMQPQQPQPLDPVSEVQALIAGQPVAAFPGQDHGAHAAFLLATTQDPAYASMMASIAPRLQALHGQHMALMRREEIEAELGMPLPPQGQPLPPQVAAQVARTVAEAAARLAQARMPAEDGSAAEAQMIALQQEELRLQEKKIDSQESQNVANLATRQLELALREREIGAREAEAAQDARVQLAQSAIKEQGAFKREGIKARAKLADSALRALEADSKANDRKKEGK